MRPFLRHGSSFSDAAERAAVDMESAELYTLAARKRVQALAILTISDVLPTGERVSASDRENTFGDMVRIALDIA